MQGRWPGMGLLAPPLYTTFIFPFSLLLWCKEGGRVWSSQPLPSIPPSYSLFFYSVMRGRWPGMELSAPPLYTTFVTARHAFSFMITTMTDSIHLLVKVAGYGAVSPSPVLSFLAWFQQSKHLILSMQKADRITPAWRCGMLPLSWFRWMFLLPAIHKDMLLPCANTCQKYQH